MHDFKSWVDACAREEQQDRRVLCRGAGVREAERGYFLIRMWTHGDGSEGCGGTPCYTVDARTFGFPRGALVLLQGSLHHTPLLAARKLHRGISFANTTRTIILRSRRFRGPVHARENFTVRRSVILCDNIHQRNVDGSHKLVQVLHPGSEMKEFERGREGEEKKNPSHISSRG